MQKKPRLRGGGGFPWIWGLPRVGGAPPEPVGSPQSRVSKLQVAAGEGKGWAGARRGGVGDKPSSEALDLWREKGGKMGNLGEFLHCLFLVCRGGDGGRGFSSEVVPKRAQGGPRLGAVAGEAQHGEGALIEGVISTQSPIAAPHPLGDCFKGMRGPGSGTSTCAGATGTRGQLPALAHHLWGWDTGKVQLQQLQG